MKRFTTFLVVLSAILVATTVIGWNKEDFCPPSTESASENTLTSKTDQQQEPAYGEKLAPLVDSLTKKLDKLASILEHSIVTKDTWVEQLTQTEQLKTFFQSQNEIQTNIQLFDLKHLPSTSCVSFLGLKKNTTPTHAKKTQPEDFYAALAQLTEDNNELDADYATLNLAENKILFATNEDFMRSALEFLAKQKLNTKGGYWIHNHFHEAKQRFEYWTWHCLDDKKNACLLGVFPITLSNIDEFASQLDENLANSIDRLILEHEGKLFGKSADTYANVLNDHLQELQNLKPKQALDVVMPDGSVFIVAKKSLPGNNSSILLIEHPENLHIPQNASVKPQYTSTTLTRFLNPQTQLPLGLAAGAFLFVLLGGLIIVHFRFKESELAKENSKRSHITLEKKLELITEEKKELTAKFNQLKTQFDQAKTAYVEQKDLRLKAENTVKEVQEENEVLKNSGVFPQFVPPAVSSPSVSRMTCVNAENAQPTTPNPVLPEHTQNIEQNSNNNSLSGVFASTNQEYSKQKTDTVLSDSEWEELAESFDAMMSKEFGLSEVIKPSPKLENKTDLVTIVNPVVNPSPNTLTGMPSPTAEPKTSTAKLSAARVPSVPAAAVVKRITPNVPTKERITPVSSTPVESHATMLGIPVVGAAGITDKHIPVAENSVNSLKTDAVASMGPAAQNISIPSLAGTRPLGLKPTATTTPTFDPNSSKGALLDTLTSKQILRPVPKSASKPVAAVPSPKPSSPSLETSVDSKSLRDALKRRSEDAKTRPQAESQNPQNPPKALSKSGLFSVTGSRVDIDPLNDTEYFKNLYETFVTTKEKCGEVTDNVTLERFMSRLARNKESLMNTYKCKTVKFQVYIKDGKTALKATPVK